MKAKDEDLELTTRKALVARILRSRAEVGALEQEEFLVMQGRIEQARTREELDALQAEMDA